MDNKMEKENKDLTLRVRFTLTDYRKLKKVAINKHTTISFLIRECLKNEFGI